MKELIKIKTAEEAEQFNLGDVILLYSGQSAKVLVYYGFIRQRSCVTLKFSSLTNEEVSMTSGSLVGCEYCLLDEGQHPKTKKLGIKYEFDNEC